MIANYFEAADYYTDFNTYDPYSADLDDEGEFYDPSEERGYSVPLETWRRLSPDSDSWIHKYEPWEEQAQAVSFFEQNEKEEDGLTQLGRLASVFGSVKDPRTKTASERARQVAGSGESVPAGIKMAFTAAGETRGQLMESIMGNVFRSPQARSFDNVVWNPPKVPKPPTVQKEKTTIGITRRKQA